MDVFAIRTHQACVAETLLPSRYGFCGGVDDNGQIKGASKLPLVPRAAGRAERQQLIIGSEILLPQPHQFAF